MTRSTTGKRGAPRTRKGGNSEHDHGFKFLFSKPHLVEALLRGFLPASWVEQLDFSTLRRGRGSYVTDDLRERHDDIIWSLRWKDDRGEHWFWIYLLLEFQSTPDRFMAVRLLTYVGLLLQDLIDKELEPGDLLPPVLPIVLYHGKPKWRASLDLASLFAPVPREVQRHLPQLSYRLLDAGRLPLDDPELRDNLLAATLRLETAELRQASSRLEDLKVLVPPELRRIYNIWLDRRFRRYPFAGRIPRGKINLESAAMLEETFREWEQKMRQEGRHEGRQEGRQEGLQKGLQKGLQRGRREGRQEGRREGEVEGMQKIALEMLRQRFGPVPQEVRRRVREISSSSELTKLTRRILTARSLQETDLL
ncbi:MAG TPA: Rpn family recombination-promoting nuclease/putative transposase [Thermoanaerobaculia bacterium]|nr:Rpn family recombination-promoting nuclease/putative transposase [Thermoanaerobaculia bacterium]